MPAHNTGACWASLLPLPGFDDLTADQRAVLQLVLLRGQTYSQIAAVLRTDADTIRARAAGAVADLTGADRPEELSGQELELLSDHVLGQAAPGAADHLLDRSSAARAWQRSAREALSAAGLLSGAQPSSPPPTAVPGDAAEPASDDSVPASRTGGAILLGLVAAGLVLVVLLVAGVFDGGSPKQPATAAKQATGPTDGVRIFQQVNMRPPSGASSPKAVALFAEQGGDRAMQIVGQGLAPSSFYALWTQTGDRWRRLGFAPPVRPDGKAKGQLTIEAPLTDAVLAADRLVISREREKDPASPNQVVLSGPIKKS